MLIFQKLMRYTIRQLAEIIGGEFLNNPVQEAVIEHILLDSRQVVFPAGSVFIALQGRRFDGHEFLESLYQSGIRNFIISDNSQFSTLHSQLKTSNFILVKDTHAAFHELATWHRHQYSLPVIGITGSNGKTIVKEWLYQLLFEDYHIVRSPKSYNSQTGVPLSVLQITPEHSLGIFEAGISQMDEMAKLAPILDPCIGIFTNIGDAHSEGFPDIETKLKEKLKLFQNAKTVIFCCDDERVEGEIRSLRWARKKSGNEKPGLTSWSAKGKEADLQVEFSLPPSAGSKGEEKTTTIHCQFRSEKFNVRLSFTDAASLENAAHCIALMLHLGYAPSTIALRLSKLEPVAMRLELKEGINGCILINDSYNSDLTSLGIALNFLEQQSASNKNTRRTLILSDILQSGQQREQLYGAIANLILEKKIDRFIGIGSEVAILYKFLPQEFEAIFFNNTVEFLEHFHSLEFREEVILLKGARRFEFERIANRLATKIHQTTLEVNLGALLHNLRVYQSYLHPETKMMVMVKAGAYGSGSAEVAKLLEFQHVDYLGVAYADEGVDLRKAGIQLPVMVMNPEEATFDSLVRYKLEPEIYSHSLLEKFLRFAERFSEDFKPAIHLKLDTGMHRLGFEEKDLDELISAVRGSFNKSPVIIKSIFSHLAASDSPSHDDFTRLQVDRFLKLYEKLAGGLGYRPLRHILNSGGIIRFPEYQMDMVRLGIGLYGIDSSGMVQDRLQTVNTLKATISQIKIIEAFETVGYNRMGKADKPMRIATLSLGYADGLLRRAGNGRYSVLIKGKKAPLVGNVCMDMVMADITQIPEAQEGDSAVVFGKELPVEELASCLGTIPYEIFTTISERVKRVYVQE